MFKFLYLQTGHGSMGISNSIGSNTFDILLCLGLPWLIKASLTPAEPGHYWVRDINNYHIFKLLMRVIQDIVQIVRIL